jgi:hypothetical protein
MWEEYTTWTLSKNLGEEEKKRKAKGVNFPF